MTLMLASVNSLEEAKLALAADVDLIDLKQPALGALGALEINVVQQIAGYCQGQRPVSATIGDLPMQPDRILDAVQAMSETGVDFIKIGFFPGGDWAGTVRKLSSLAEQGLALIAVLFADSEPDFAIINDFKRAGFCGVMLDTREKSKGSLAEVMPPAQIKRFVVETQSRNMLCGLAGSLRLSDIPRLMVYQPDYLGFRGALCVRRQRTARLDECLTAAIKAAMVRSASDHFETTPSFKNRCNKHDVAESADI